MSQMSMRKRLLIGTVAAALAWLLAGTALADNGPHTGDYTKTTDACAGCHRAHRGQRRHLLKGMGGPMPLSDSWTDSLCFSCHGSAATGADTNVEDGIYANRVSGGAYGTVNAGLRGGGFVNALMDPDMDGTPSSAPVTSRHRIGEPGLTIWGLGSSGVGHVTSSQRATLRCTSCHNPHGFRGADYYRILRIDLPCGGCHTIHGSTEVDSNAPPPNDSNHSFMVEMRGGIPDETPKNYTITYNAAGYRDVSYLSEVISEWCATCHTRYLANSANNSGDDIFTYRHVTSDNQRKCLVCHVVHGTSATMAAFSGNVEWPDDTAGGGASDSRLLHVDNRGVCYQCHQAP